MFLSDADSQVKHLLRRPSSPAVGGRPCKSIDRVTDQPVPRSVTAVLTDWGHSPATRSPLTAVHWARPQRHFNTAVIWRHGGLLDESADFICKSLLVRLTCYLGFLHDASLVSVYSFISRHSVDVRLPQWTIPMLINCTYLSWNYLLTTATAQLLSYNSYDFTVRRPRKAQCMLSYVCLSIYLSYLWTVS